MGPIRQSGLVRILGRDVPVGYDRPDWRIGPISKERLETVTLHYHEWTDDVARAGAADVFGHYVSDWIARCPVDAPGSRHLAWNAYAVATRIGWWVRAAISNPAVRTPTVLRSLWE